jgi:hypothetical protein
MTVLDVLGLLAFLGTSLALMVALVTLIYCLARHRWSAAGRIAGGVALLLVAYAAALLAASLLSHDRQLARGERRCFDDWCVSVAERRVMPSSGDELLVVALDVSSRARRVTQRPSEPRFWVEDAQGTRYDISPDDQVAWDAEHGPNRPVNDRIGPGEHFDTTLVFRLPATTDRPALIVAEGPSWVGRVLIGSEDSPFHGRTKFPLSGP